MTSQAELFELGFRQVSGGSCRSSVSYMAGPNIRFWPQAAKAYMFEYSQVLGVPKWVRVITFFNSNQPHFDA